MLEKKITSLISKQSKKKYYSSISNKQRLLLYKTIKNILKNNEYNECFRLNILETYKINPDGSNGSFVIDLNNDNFILSFTFINEGKKTFNNIFFALLSDKKNIYNIACKIIINDIENNKEINILNKLNNYVINKETIHFPLTYSIINCNLIDLFSLFINKNKLLNNLNSKYKLILNEKADGDLINYYHTYNINTNDLIMQLLICILTLNSKKIIHKDINEGNFLYHIDNNIKDNKNYYIKYNIIYYDFEDFDDGINEIIYIKIYNKAIWTLWDFEISEEVRYNILSNTDDYYSMRLMLYQLLKNDDLINLNNLYSTINLLSIKNIIKYLIYKYKILKDKDYLLYNNEPYIIKFENHE